MPLEYNTDCQENKYKDVYYRTSHCLWMSSCLFSQHLFREDLWSNYVSEQGVREREKERESELMASGCACRTLTISFGVSGFSGCLEVARRVVKGAWRREKARCWWVVARSNGRDWELHWQCVLLFTAMAEHWIHDHGNNISIARSTPAESKASISVGVTHKTNMGQHYNLHKMVREDICEGCIWIKEVR